MLKDLKKSTGSTGGGSDFVAADEIKLDGGDNLVRIIDPENDISYWESWITCSSDGVKRSFIVHNSLEGSSILGKIIGDVKFFFKGGILETKKGESGHAEYKWNSVEDPEIIDIVRNNGDKINDNSGWKPKQKFIFNAIDRRDTWCKDNKKTKVLKIGRSLGEELVLIEESNGPVDQYDINIIRSGQGMRGTNYKPTVPGAFAKDKFPNIVFGPISEEEKAYAMQDLKKITGLKSATSILKYLREHIIRVGKVMGQDFIPALEAQAEAELEVWNANKEAGVPTNAPSEASNDSAVPFKEPAPSTRAPKADVAQQACSKCGFMNPVDAEKCGGCQALLLQACDTCHKMVSVTATECPFCKSKFIV